MTSTSCPQAVWREPTSSQPADLNLKPTVDLETCDEHTRGTENQVVLVLRPLRLLLGRLDPLFEAWLK
jgi:hypothetical protein